MDLQRNSLLENTSKYIFALNYDKSQLKVRSIFYNLSYPRTISKETVCTYTITGYKDIERIVTLYSQISLPRNSWTALHNNQKYDIIYRRRCFSDVPPIVCSKCEFSSNGTFKRYISSLDNGSGSTIIYFPACNNCNSSTVEIELLSCMHFRGKLPKTHINFSHSD